LCRVAYSFVKRGEALKTVQRFYFRLVDEKVYFYIKLLVQTGIPKIIKKSTSNNGKISALATSDFFLICVQDKLLYVFTGRIMLQND
jgi:hypothetical protein